MNKLIVLIIVLYAGIRALFILEEKAGQRLEDRFWTGA